MKNPLLLFFCVCIFLCSCGKKEILNGKRESLIIDESDVIPVSNESVLIEQVSTMSRHVEVLGNKQHVAINHKMSQNPGVMWKKNVRCSIAKTGIISDSGSLYFVDKNGVLHSISQKSGDVIFNKKIISQKGSAFFGGLTAQDGIVYVSSNTGDVVAFDVKEKKEKWRSNLILPVVGAPITATRDILIVITIENVTYALNINDGSKIWSNSVEKEYTVMDKFSSPAISSNSVICAYTTGDVVSVDLIAGTENWSDSLLSTNTSESGSAISHIVASPVVRDGLVFLANAEAKMCAMDCSSGAKIWESRVGTVSTPAVFGNSVFVLSKNGDLLCLSQTDGAVKWKNDNLNDFSVVKKNGAVLKWIGPVIVNGDVVLCSDLGHISFFDIKTGKFKKRIEINDVIASEPIIVDGVMYILTKNSVLYAIG